MTTWGDGEYGLMAERLEPASVAVVRAAELRTGERVVDVATGTGNAALLAARTGAEVVGVDFEDALLDIARSLAAATGLDVRWHLADADAL